MRRHDLTNKKTMSKTKTMTITKTMTFREYPSRHLIPVMRWHDLTEIDIDNIIWRTPLIKEQSSRLVAFVTLIKFLTIENNNLNIHKDP